MTFADTPWPARALCYFAAIFGVGFLLGPMRVLWLEPRLGARFAELVEAPFMLVAMTAMVPWLFGRSLA